ncbi:MAG TPA: response regulator [Bryobacteraceae bacterium]|nr:response regulator [Bryobacteraceae bacterium]
MYDCRWRYHLAEDLLRKELEHARRRLISSRDTERAQSIAGFRSALERFNNLVLHFAVPADIESQIPASESRPKAGVMVVEDEPSVLNYIAGALSMNGYDVLPASRADEALRVARSHHGNIDLVVSDINLPEMDGTELVSRMRQERLTSRALLMTGKTSFGGDPETGRMALRKPFPPAVLIERVEMALAA